MVAGIWAAADGATIMDGAVDAGTIMAGRGVIAAIITATDIAQEAAFGSLLRIQCWCDSTI